MLFFFRLLLLSACVLSLSVDHRLFLLELLDKRDSPNPVEFQVASADKLNLEIVKQFNSKSNNFVVRLKDTNTYFVKNPEAKNEDGDDEIEMIEANFNAMDYEDEKTLSIPITPCIHQTDDGSSISVGTSFSSSWQIKPNIKGKAEVGLMVPFLMLPLSFSTTNKVTVLFSKSTEQAYECSANGGESVILLAEVLVPKYSNIKHRLVKFAKNKTYTTPWKKVKAFMNPVAHFACSTTKASNEFCFKPIFDYADPKVYSQNSFLKEFELDQNYSLHVNLPQGWRVM